MGHGEDTGDVGRDRTAAGVVFETVDPRAPDAVAAVTAYFTELDRRFVDGFDQWESITADAASFEPPAGAFVLGRVRAGDDAVACGAVQSLEPGVGEIKRMWVAPGWRGRGVASRLLAHLEGLVVAAGHHTVRLDTNAVLAEAIRMYERAGYRSIGRYNDNPYAQRWFEKRLS